MSKDQSLRLIRSMISVHTDFASQYRAIKNNNNAAIIAEYHEEKIKYWELQYQIISAKPEEKKK